VLIYYIMPRQTCKAK